jgi:hypothetical protein
MLIVLIEDCLHSPVRFKLAEDNFIAKTPRRGDARNTAALSGLGNFVNG